MPVEFQDYSIRVKAALEDAAIGFLHEAAMAVQRAAVDNSSAEEYRGKYANSFWRQTVNEAEKKATVGSPDEEAYWEEFGTGEHALYHNGRKDWWVYVEGNDNPSPNQHHYTQEEAEGIAASMRADGLPAHATNGRKPNRPLFRAFEEKKSDIKRIAEQRFGEGMD